MVEHYKALLKNKIKNKKYVPTIDLLAKIKP